ncbi:hypothetical protein NITHO_820006 [Nitrolancea hollandica Lb]|uniref:Uncharacterized protein n=1 Tax=Nitrolancea hollandica Lb TaxID=1129897 RepID=I4ENA8_9BACT|nr:hypothetical protein NITHO_820006 [Nitrolancea hollandica Lb]
MMEDAMNLSSDIQRVTLLGLEDGA